MCSDPEIAWYPQRTICYASMANEAANRAYDALHEKAPFHDGTEEQWAKDRSDARPFHYRDGVTIWVSDQDLSPGDHFLGKPNEITPETLRGI